MNGLEALEELRNSLQAYYTMENVPKIDTNLDAIEKELKALEIIKEKRLNVDEIYHKDYEWYLLDHKNDDKSLIPTKEEYELLKEVLTWKK